MRKITLFIVAILSLSYARAQSTWHPLKADNRVIVQFPSAPKEVEGNFKLTDKDNITYIFKVVDTRKVFGIDSVALVSVKRTPEFNEKLKEHIMSKFPGITVNGIVQGVWNGFTSYTSSGKLSGKNYNGFMFIIGNRLYTLSALTPPDAATTNTNRFLASAALTR